MAERTKSTAKKAVRKPTAKKVAKAKPAPQKWADPSTWAATLSGRKNRVMAEVETLEKGGTIDMGKGKPFKVVSHNQVMGLLRPLFAKHGIDLHVDIVLMESPFQGWMKADIWIRPAGLPLIEAQKDEQYSSWPVEIPKNLHEKGIGAAESYAIKYWGQRTFLIDADEDLDSNEVEKSRPLERPRAKSGSDNGGPPPAAKRKAKAKRKPPGPITKKQIARLFVVSKNNHWNSDQTRDAIHAMSWYKDPKRFPIGLSTKAIPQGAAYEKIIEFFETNEPSDFYSDENPVYTAWALHNAELMDEEEEQEESGGEEWEHEDEQEYEPEDEPEEDDGQEEADYESEQ